MFSLLLTFHSLVRWILLILICYTAFKSYISFRQKAPFTQADRWLGHWTNTFAQVQLTLGILVFLKSAVAKYFWANMGTIALDSEASFFGLFHMIGMSLAVTFISIGTASSKRHTQSDQKFKSLFKWFFAALLIIFILIPWPFSPIASRPWFRF